MFFKPKYPYSKELKKPMTFGNVDMQKAIDSGNMLKSIDFMTKPEKKAREGNEQIETVTTFKPQKNNGSKANLFQNIPETEPLSMAAGGFDIF